MCRYISKPKQAQVSNGKFNKIRKLLLTKRENNFLD